ncbi:glycosyltransferase family 4 protein [Microbacterium arborescens]
MKILTISQLPPPRHGSTIMTEHFLRAIGELGHESSLLERRFSRSVAEVGRFSIRKLGSAAWIPIRLLRAIAREKPDACVFFVTNRRLSFMVDVALTLVLRATRTPTILYVHTSGWHDLASTGWVWRKGAEYIFKKAISVVTLGPALAADLAALDVSSRLSVIRNTSEPQSATEPHNGAMSVIFISNLIPSKGVLDFLAIAEKVGSTHPSIRFTVYGATADATFEASVRERIRNARSANISFGGAIGNAESMSAVLSRADILLFPSRYEYEAQPLTIVEALSFGVPVAAYDVGGVSDIVHNDHGLLASIGDVDSIATFVSMAALDGDLLASKSRAAREFYRDHLSFEAYSRQWANVLRKATPE